MKKQSSNKKIILVGLAAAAAFIGIPFLAKAKGTKEAAEKTTFDIVAVRWGGIKNFKLNFTVDLDFFNPSNTDMIVEFLHLEFRLINKFLIAKIDKQNFANIKARQTTKITLPIELTAIQTLSIIADSIGKLLQNGKPQTLLIEGYTRVNGFTEPIQKTVNVF